MSVISPETMAKVKAIELKARHLASEQLAGEYTSAFKGRGMQFEEVREYSSGDDVRAIDWNVSARMQSPYIKVFSEEREQTLMLALDLSASMNFGSQEQTKKEYAAQIAAALAFLALRSQDKVGLLLFSQQIEVYIPPKKGQGHIWNLMRRILEYEPQGRKARYDLACDHLLRVLKRRSLLFIFADLTIDDAALGSLSRLARRHEASLLISIDPLELDCSGHGVLELTDPETKAQTLVDSDSPLLGQAWRQMIAKRKALISDAARRAKIDLGFLPSDEDFTRAILRLFRLKESRRLR